MRACPDREDCNQHDADIAIVIIYGVGYGGTIPVSSSLRANYFGRKTYATITGYTTLFMALTNIVYLIFAG